jgi:hypothetical protein
MQSWFPGYFANYGIPAAEAAKIAAEQLAMAKRAHAHVTEVKAPHLSMVSDPGAVTGVILKAVHATA